MHELRPLCSRWLDGEWCTRLQYGNIEKWTPRVLLWHRWTLLCVSGPWKGYNLWKREGAPSQRWKNRTGEECRRLSRNWSPTCNGVRCRSTPKPKCSTLLPFEGLPASDLKCPRTLRHSFCACIYYLERASSGSQCMFLPNVILPCMNWLLFASYLYLIATNEPNTHYKKKPVSQSKVRVVTYAASSLGTLEKAPLPFSFLQREFLLLWTLQ